MENRIVVHLSGNGLMHRHYPEILQANSRIRIQNSLGRQEWAEISSCW